MTTLSDGFVAMPLQRRVQATWQSSSPLALGHDQVCTTAGSYLLFLLVVFMDNDDDEEDVLLKSTI